MFCVFVKYLMIVLYVKVVVVCVYDSPTCKQRMVAVRVTRSTKTGLVPSIHGFRNVENVVWYIRGPTRTFAERGSSNSQWEDYSASKRA